MPIPSGTGATTPAHNDNASRGDDTDFIHMLRRIYPPMLAVCKEWADLEASAATPTLEKASDISQPIVRLSNLTADESYHP
jgi:hypothetical protein